MSYHKAVENKDQSLLGRNIALLSVFTPLPKYTLTISGNQQAIAIAYIYST